METYVQRSTRLVDALEDLVADETAALRTRDFAAAATIAWRAAPVVEWRVAHASVITPGLRERLARVHANRAANVEFLETEIGQTRESLQQLGASRRRVAQIAPIYGGRAAVQSARLSAVG